MNNNEHLLVLLDRVLPLVRFRTPGIGSWDHNVFRLGYHESQTSDGVRRGLRPSFFALAEVEINEAAKPLFERLTEVITAKIAPHIDPKTSQIAFTTTLPLAWSWPQPDVHRFSRQVVRCAALAGSERAVRLLDNCIQGERIGCTHVTVLEGIHQEQECLEFRDGTRLLRLSRGFDDLVRVIPEMLAYRLAHDPLNTDLPGATALCVDVSATLAIARPDQANTSLDESFFPDPLLMQALSLACNASVDPIHHWIRLDSHFGALTGCQVGHAMTPHPLHSRTTTRRLRPVALTQEHVDCARRLHDGLLKQSGDQRLRVAIERWQGSNTLSGNTVNGAIDIRIALEALFAPTTSKAELGHRIALRGAWYLGNNPDDRIRYHRIFKGAYDMCSRAVHSGSLRHGKASTSDVSRLLDEARNACRESLIKRLDEDRQLDDDAWTALVLGKL